MNRPMKKPMKKLVISFILAAAMLASPEPLTLRVYATNSTKNAGTGADDSTVGTVSWTNPGNATTSNGSFATAGALFGDQTHYLKMTNFGFSIPSGATINGIQVIYDHLYTPNTVSPGPSWTVVKMVKNGTISGNNLGSGSMLSGQGNATFGSGSQLWGLTWTDTDINASTHGVVCSVTDTTFAGTTAKIDGTQMTVTYTVSSGGVPPRRIIMSQTRKAGSVQFVLNPNNRSPRCEVRSPRSMRLRTADCGLRTADIP